MNNGMNTDINNDKPPIIFIPGMMCDWRLFAPQIAALNNYISHDATLSEHDSIESMASAILRDTPPIFNLVGLSMGWDCRDGNRAGCADAGAEFGTYGHQPLGRGGGY